MVIQPCPHSFLRSEARFPLYGNQIANKPSIVSTTGCTSVATSASSSSPLDAHGSAGPSAGVGDGGSDGDGDGNGNGSVSIDVEESPRTVERKRRVTGTGLISNLWKKTGDAVRAGNIAAMNGDTDDSTGANGNRTNEPTHRVSNGSVRSEVNDDGSVVVTAESTPVPSEKPARRLSRAQHVFLSAAASAAAQRPSETTQSPEDLAMKMTPGSVGGAHVGNGGGGASRRVSEAGVKGLDSDATSELECTSSSEEEDVKETKVLDESSEEGEGGGEREGRGGQGRGLNGARGGAGGAERGRGVGEGGAGDGAGGGAGDRGDLHWLNPVGNEEGGEDEYAMSIEERLLRAKKMNIKRLARNSGVPTFASPKGGDGSTRGKSVWDGGGVGDGDGDAVGGGGGGGVGDRDGGGGGGGGGGDGGSGATDIGTEPRANASLSVEVARRGSGDIFELLDSPDALPASPRQALPPTPVPSPPPSPPPPDSNEVGLDGAEPLPLPPPHPLPTMFGNDIAGAGGANPFHDDGVNGGGGGSDGGEDGSGRGGKELIRRLSSLVLDAPPGRRNSGRGGGGAPDFDALLEQEEERKSMQAEQSRDLDLIHSVLSQLYSTVDQLTLEADTLRAERDALKTGDVFDAARREVRVKTKAPSGRAVESCVPRPTPHAPRSTPVFSVPPPPLDPVPNPILTIPFY